MSTLDDVTGGHGHENTGARRRGGAATQEPRPRPQCMGSSVTPHALFSREGQKVPFTGEKEGVLSPVEGPRNFRLITAMVPFS